MKPLKLSITINIILSLTSKQSSIVKYLWGKLKAVNPTITVVMVKYVENPFYFELPGRILSSTREPKSV